MFVVLGASLLKTAVVRGILAMRCSSRFLTVVAALAKGAAAYALLERVVYVQMEAVTPI